MQENKHMRRNAPRWQQLKISARKNLAGMKRQLTDLEQSQLIDNADQSLIWQQLTSQ